MPNTYIKNGGVWRRTTALYYKEGSNQRAIRRVYRKHQGVWRQVFGSSGTTTWTTPGSYTFTVPDGVYSLSIAYPTTTGMVNTTLPVTPGQSVPVVIGAIGAASTIGAINTGAFTKQVISWGGNIDHTVQVYFRPLTTGGITASYSGKRPTLNTNFGSVGIYYNEGSEVYHGDLSAGVTIYSLPTGTLVNTTEIYFISTGGRNTKTIYQHPTAGNNWTGVFGFFDPNSNEGYYSANVGLRQIVPITVSW